MDSHSNTIVHTDEVNVEPLISIENKTTHAPPSRTLIERFSGIFYALLSSLFFTTSVFITKQLHIDLLDALIFRFFFQTISLIIYMKFIKHYSLYSHTKSNERITLFVNAFFSTTAFLSFFIGYRYLPLPDLTTIRYTQVVWTVFIAAFIYREKPSIPTILAMFLTILGVVFVAQPEFIFKKVTQSIDHSQRIIGIVIALYSSVAMAIMVISNRILLVKYKSKQSLILFQFAIVLLFVTLIHLIVNVYLHSNSIDYLKSLILNWTYVGASLACLLQMFGSILIQKAFKREHPAIITIVQSSDILFSIVLQNIFTSLKSNLLSLFGSVLVLSSILIISLSKLCHEIKQ